MRAKHFLLILLAGTLLASSPVLAQTAEQPKAPPPQAEKSAVPAPQAEKAPAPEPMQVLQKMCDFLKSQQQFTYKAAVAADQVDEDGRKLQYDFDMGQPMAKI